MAIPPRVDVIAAPGETNTIVWATDTTYTTPIILSVTEATAPMRIGGDFSAECRKVLRTAMCRTPATGLVVLGDGADTFTAPLSVDSGMNFTCCYTPQFSVYGGPGNDRILASVQNDGTIDGGSGNDLIVQGPTREVHGGTGDDTIVLLRPDQQGFFPNTYYDVDCGAGRDTIAMPSVVPTPPDCERRISLPDAVAQIPSLLGYLP
jgi:hypothetical protein